MNAVSITFLICLECGLAYPWFDEIMQNFIYMLVITRWWSQSLRASKICTNLGTHCGTNLRCKSQALMRFVKRISFNSCGIQISSFLTSPRRCIWRSIVDFVIFNISSISCTVTWRSDLIIALIWSSSPSFGRSERCSSLNEKSPERNLSNQFRHCLLRLPHHTHHVTF